MRGVGEWVSGRLFGGGVSTKLGYGELPLGYGGASIGVRVRRGSH